MAVLWVVDDEESVRDLLGEMLQEMGHECRLFADAGSLLEAYRPGVADAIITDVRMAGMDGIALTRELLRRDPSALVLILTAYPSIQDAVELIRLGAVDYLQKPFHSDEIRLRLERALQGRDIRRKFHKNRYLTWILIGMMPLWFVLGYIIARGG